MVRRRLYAAVAVAVLVVLALGFLAQQNGMNVSTTSQSSSGSPRMTSTLQGVNQTVLATYAGPLVTTTSSMSSTVAATSTTSATSSEGATTSSQTTPGGSFTYSPSSQVRVLSVSATVSGGTVGFTVQFTNDGSTPIYVLGGGGSSLSAAFVSGNQLVKEVQSPRCEIATTMVQVSPGSSARSLTPGCWSGYYYQLIGQGGVEVQLTLAWSNSPGGPPVDSVQIDAEFVLG